jgi:hypothetical protein
MSSRLLFVRSFLARAFSLLIASILLTSQADALPRTWIGGNVDWVDAGAAANWNPADEPDSDDEAIFNTANTVNLGSNNAVNGLTLSGGIDLFTNDFDLTVDGLVQTAGAGTNLIIGGAAGSVDADNVTINGGVVELSGGTLTLNEEAGASLLDVNAGGTLFGTGVITFADAPLAFTTVFSNDGTLTALSRPLIIFGAPPVGTLQINTANTFSLVDLDGAGNAGVVNVNRNQTLDVNGALADAFGGTMTLFQESTLDMSNSWGLNAGTLTANNGFVLGGLGVPDTPAGKSYIKGGTLTQTGGVISVPDNDGTLQFDANFTLSGGTFSNNGKVIFNGTANVTNAASWNPASLGSSLEINNAMTVTDAAGNFNWDGPATSSTTINGAGSLSIAVNQIDTGDDVYGGTITLNDTATLSVTVAGTSWTLTNTLNKNNVGTSLVSGDRIVIDGAVNANAGTLDLPAVTTGVTANISVAGTLTLGGASEFGGAASIAGAGLLRMEGTSTVTANTTVNVATFDWDGLGTGTNHTVNAGVVFTINSATLDSDGDMDDPVNLAGNGSQLIVNGPTEWTATAAVNANNAGAGTATIGGTSRFILSGASADLNVNGNTNIAAPITFGADSSASIDAGMTLDLGASAAYQAGTISGAGTFVPAATNLVTGVTTITAANFDFDGGSWTIEDDGELIINVGDYDPGVVTNTFDGVVNLDNGEIDVSTGDVEFVMDGTINSHADGTGQSLWTGEAIDIGNDAGALDADLNVTGTQPTQFGAQVDFNSDADVNVADGASLHFLALVIFNSVNGGNNAEFTGSGEMIFSDGVNISEATTLNMAGGIVDLDGADSVGDTINIDATLTINAELFRGFGKNNGGGGTNILDVNNSVGTGVLTVNLDDPNGEWTLNGPGVMNLVNDNTDATLLAGSDVNVNGTVNVTGDVRSTARLDVAGVVNINTVGQPLRLAGGNNTDDPNTIAGGTITGVGVLGADTNKALQGFGTINANIDFDGDAKLQADNGTLTINGAILDAGQVGTADVDGALHVTNAWNNNVTTGVQLHGGTLSGGTITNDVTAGISGHGLVTARVINNTQLFASLGDALIFETPGNDNDWDGLTNAGEIEAVSANIELRDVGAAFGFTGTVTASNNNTAFANGFALDFNPGSTLSLASGGRYQSTSSTDLGGAVNVGGGGATIEVENNFFLTFEIGSSTTLNSNLQLVNNNVNIEAGATFAGGGALVVPDGSNLVADNLANVGVLLDMQGGFRPGNSAGIGRIDLFDYQQADTGELFVELTGTGLNQFDRLVASGDVILDGYLNIDVDEVSPGVPFVPVLGQTFNIITGNTVTGAFDYADVSGMPDGLSFHINYLANAVQLQVVNTPLFSADFDDDGDVDPTDLAIWKGAFGLNQLGDADGDNDSDGADFLLWQQQFGSAPAVAVAQPAAAAVPEPASMALALFTLALFAHSRSKFHIRSSSPV